MQNEKRSKFIQFLRGYGWVALVTLCLLLTGFLTRSRWPAAWRAASVPAAVRSSATPVMLSTATDVSMPTPEPTETLTPTLQPTREAVNGYTNPLGEYGFNYPANWLNLGEQNGAEVAFFLPDVKIEVNLQDAPPGITYDQIQKNVDSYAFFHSVFLKTYLDGQEALQEDVIDDQQALRGRYYHVLRAGKYYLIGLTSDMESEQAVDVSGILPQYDRLVQSFQFTAQQGGQ